MLTRLSAVSRNKHEIILLNLGYGTISPSNISLKHLGGSIAILSSLRKEKDNKAYFKSVWLPNTPYPPQI